MRCSGADRNHHVAESKRSGFPVLATSTELKTAGPSAHQLSTRAIKRLQKGEQASPTSLQGNINVASTILGKVIPLRSDVFSFLINLTRINPNCGRLAMLLHSIHATNVLSTCSPLQSLREKNRCAELKLQEQERSNKGRDK